MRRTTGMLTVCLCAAVACRGGAAQEPYDGVIATAQRAAAEARIPATAAPEPDRIASEVDVPWTIALLSNAKTSAVRKPGKVVVDAEPELHEITVEEVDIRFAVDPGPVEEKPATPKTCTGVVKTRS